MIVCTHSKNCAHTHSHIDTHTNIHKHKSTFIPVINDHKRHENQWIHSPQTCTHTQRKLFSCDTRQSELIASDSINQREKAKCEREKRERARVRARERKWNQEREARVCWERKRKQDRESKRERGKSVWIKVKKGEREGNSFRETLKD